ncbi:MAG: creatininase [Desulfobacteraceae bacterium]|nr:creatininase [Desulfobacteraceae bacterium]
MKTRLISQMTWEDYRSEIEDGILVLPVGATEQHAKHLPLGVDSIITENIALSLADRIGALVAPTLSYGYKSQPSSGGGPLFPGTIDLNGATFTNLVHDILMELLDDGWQKIVVLNGHFENEAFLVEAADLVLRNQESPFPKVLITSWWSNISSELVPKIFDEVEFAGWELEHAAIVETSVMMYFAPDLVHEDRFLEEGLEKIPTYHCFPPSRTLLPASGCLHTARSSSDEKGRLIVENVVENIEAFSLKEFKK